MGLSIIREIGPVSVALAFAGRVGSGISSEIGSMVLGHQVDVMRVHGISPLKRLVKPRVLSALIMLPVLTILGDALALIGGFYIAVFESTQSGAFYWMQISQIINIESLLLGLSKPILFGYLVACISCYMGLSTKGGAKGLRKTTTEAVVFSTLMIIVSDFLVTKLILFITRGAG